MNSFISVVVPQFAALDNVALLSDGKRPEIDRYKILPTLENIYDISEKFDPTCLRGAKSVFFLSVGPHNANLILQTLGCVGPEQVYILITDDEVNRFRRCRQLFGRLRVSKRYRIDQDVLQVLEAVDNYFTLREPWGNVLESILEKRLFVSDCTSFRPLSIIRRELAELAETDPSRNDNALNILNDSRPTKSFDRLLFVLACYALIFRSSSLKSITKIRIYLWMPPRAWRITSQIERALKKLIVATLRSRGIDLMFCDIYRMPLEEYKTLLSKIDIMPLRVRGGGGGAMMLLSQGGTVVFKKNSLNQRAFGNYFEGNKLPKYSSYFGFFWNLPDLLGSRTEFRKAFKEGALKELEIKERFYASFFG